MTVAEELAVNEQIRWERDIAIQQLKELGYSLGEKIRAEEDCVSKQATIDVLSLGKEILSRVLDDMDVVGTDREKYSWGLELIGSYIEDIEELPSVQPQQKKGKWIRNDNGTWSCDQCNSWIPDEQHYYARFCLYCGAKMEGSK